MDEDRAALISTILAWAFTALGALLLAGMILMGTWMTDGKWPPNPITLGLTVASFVGTFLVVWMMKRRR